jgi:hypothetical protein
MVDSADSMTRSHTPAGSVLADGVLRSMRMSRCRPWCTSSTPAGASLALEADELLRVFQRLHAAVLQRHLQRAGLRPRSRSSRRASPCFSGAHAVEHVACVGDDPGAAHRVVAAALLGAVGLGQHVGAVERVVQAAPARVGGVQRIARVGDRHHQLRAGLQREFGVDVLRRHLHRAGVGHQVADLVQELAVPSAFFIGPGLARCQASSSACRRSRSASRAAFFGARSATILSKPAQKSRRRRPCRAAPAGR